MSLFAGSCWTLVRKMMWCGLVEHVLRLKCILAMATTESSQAAELPIRSTDKVGMMLSAQVPAMITSTVVKVRTSFEGRAEMTRFMEMPVMICCVAAAETTP